MRICRTLLILGFCIAVAVIYILYYLLQGISVNELVEKKQVSDPILHIAVVSCGQRVQETLVMIKSALLFNHSKNFLRFFVFSEDEVLFREKLDDWKEQLTQQFDFELLPLRFPSTNDVDWRNLFKPCAAQRLFLPTLLHKVDTLLYVDTDVLFLSPVSDIWRFLSQFNSSQIAALTPEHEEQNKNIGWYNRFARHPYYGQLGVNSGVMLMNLTRMRQFNWEAHILPIYKEYKLRITWGDQDIINILFYYYPEMLYILPCEYNYRPDHCMYTSVCNASREGIKLVHGNRGYFHTSKQPLFSVIYEAVEAYQLGTNPYSNFLVPLEDALEEKTVSESSCGKLTKESVQVAKQLFLSEYSYEN